MHKISHLPNPTNERFPFEILISLLIECLWKWLKLTPKCFEGNMSECFDSIDDKVLFFEIKSIKTEMGTISRNKLELGNIDFKWWFDFIQWKFNDHSMKIQSFNDYSMII